MLSIFTHIFVGVILISRRPGISAAGSGHTPSNSQPLPRNYLRVGHWVIPQACEQVTTDSTVQTKAVAHPTNGAFVAWVAEAVQIGSRRSG